jgi:hypothetical protein
VFFSTRCFVTCVVRWLSCSTTVSSIEGIPCSGCVSNFPDFIFDISRPTPLSSTLMKGYGAF